MTTTAPPTPKLAETQAARDALDLRMIPIGDIAADPDQPRKTFDAASIAELGESMRQAQTNPIKVRARRVDEKFLPHIKWVLMHGERRLRAAHKAEIPRLRAEVGWSVAEGDEAWVLLEQLSDNLQRVDLGAIEEAAGIRRYAELSNLGTKEVAAKLGKNPMYVSLAIGMGDMPTAIVKRIEADARDEDAMPISWRHLRQLVRLKDHPVEFGQIYDCEIVDNRSTARELENAVTQELEWIEQKAKQKAVEEKAAAKAKAEGKPTPKPAADGPMSHMSEKAKREALEKARMTRVRKGLIQGSVPAIVAAVAEIAKTIRLPDGLALVAAERISGYDVARSHQASTNYGDDIAALVVPELPGKWDGWAGRSGTPIGSALNGGRRAKDDEAGRQWLAFAHWLATETKGLDADLDRQSRDVLKKRDANIKEATKPIKRASSRGMIQPKAKKTGVAARPEMQRCARKDCSAMFQVKKGPGRRPKYCPLHRSR